MVENKPDTVHASSQCIIKEEPGDSIADANGLSQSSNILRDTKGNITNMLHMRQCSVVINRTPLLENMAAKRASGSGTIPEQVPPAVDMNFTNPQLQVKQEPKEWMPADNTSIPRMKREKEEDIKVEYEDFEVTLNDIKIEDHTDSPVLTSVPYGDQSREPPFVPILSHYGVKQFYCVHCDKCFQKRTSLRTHLLTHSGLKPFKCDQCGKCFSQSRYLNRHLVTHSGKKQFKCEQCGNCFTHSATLTKHLVTHCDERPFKCDQCGNSFKNAGNLRRHLLTHSGVRPFKCDQCGRCFLENRRLSRHLLIHSGVKPFKCDQCGKSFSQKSYLRIHLLIHSEAKQFKCDQCDKCFSQRTSLRKHRLNPFSCTRNSTVVVVRKIEDYI